jgi:hypothetical protein
MERIKKSEIVILPFAVGFWLFAALKLTANS